MWVEKRDVIFLLCLPLVLLWPQLLPGIPPPSKKLYAVTLDFLNLRSPLTKFRLKHSARLQGHQVITEVELAGAFQNSNASQLRAYPYLARTGMVDRVAYGEMIGLIHGSMLLKLKEFWNYPEVKRKKGGERLVQKLSQGTGKWGGYFKSMPAAEAQAFREYLRREAFLSYKVLVHNKAGCGERDGQNDYDLKNEVLERSLPVPMNQATKNNYSLPMTPLFQKQLPVSIFLYPRCEHTESSIVHIPRAPEPREVEEEPKEVKTWDDLVDCAWNYVVYGQPTAPKLRLKPVCHTSAHVLKGNEVSGIPDILVSVLFCY